MDVDVCARISMMVDDDAYSVENQIAECREYAEAQGWTVVDVFRDDGISATKGKRREGFEGMLARTVKRPVVMWNLDRALRLSRDLERVIDQDLTIYGVQSGMLDLSTPAGRAVARTITAWTTYETEIKSERQRLANKYAAADGKPLWRVAPYGHDVEGRVVPEEAQNVREAVSRILAGQSPNSVRKWLGEQGGPRYNIQRLLSNPRLVGHNYYKGERMSKSVIEPILDEQTFYDLQAVLFDPAKRTSGVKTGKVSHLLSGIAVCGVCEARMISGVDHRKRNPYHYRCMVGHNFHPRMAVDTTVERATIERLSSDEAPTLVERHAETPESVREELNGLRERLAGWQAVAADISPGEYVAATKGVRQRITEIEEQMKAASHQSLFEGLDLHPNMTMREWFNAKKEMSARWRGLSLNKQREIVDSLWDIRLTPRPSTGPKRQMFKEGTVHLVPK